mgnify:CR=1 FL=1
MTRNTLRCVSIKNFLLSAGKTRSSILISCGARLAPFDIREVRELMEDDELELDTIGDEKNRPCSSL